MLTLERVKQQSQSIEVGTKLFCYEQTNQFTLYGEYSIYQAVNGGYMVEGDTDLIVWFESAKALQQIFMIEE